jgi:hypothetical protein
LLRCSGLFALVLVQACIPMPAALQPNRGGLGGATDPRVVAIQDAMLHAMGGREGWDRARYFEFDAILSRPGQPAERWRHRWDRRSGAVRSSGAVAGDSLVVLLDTRRPRRDRVWRGGTLVTGAAAEPLLVHARARFHHHARWLLVPFLLEEPGVTLAFMGRQINSAGDVHDALRVSFAAREHAPAEEFIALVDPATGLVHACFHYADDGTGVHAAWNGWRRVGSILVATTRAAPDGSFTLRFPRARISRRVPSGAFSTP